MSQFQSVAKLIMAGQLDEARELLNSIRPESEIEKRQHGHYAGVIELRRGGIANAAEIFSRTLALHGENVKLLRDLACAHRDLQDMRSFREVFTRLERVMVENRDRLSFSSRFNVQLMMAKFREEDGFIALAIHEYRKLLELTVFEPQIGSREVILAQLVRAKALYDPDSLLSTYYSELLAVPQDLTLEANIEMEHALMLAEITLIGPTHAWSRVSRCLETPLVVDADRRLLYYDFLEGCLAQGHQIPERAIAAATIFSPLDLDIYEQHVHSLAFGTLSVKHLLAPNLAAQLCWASHVRLLCAFANSQDEIERLEVQRKIQLLLGAVDAESRLLWKKRLRKVLGQSSTKLEFSALRRMLFYSGKMVDLSRKKGMLQLLEQLSQNNALSIDEAIQLLWQTDFTPEHYHRLRMTVHRLNQLIHSSTQSGKVLEVDSESVRLKPGVKLVAQESSAEIVGI